MVVLGVFVACEQFTIDNYQYAKNKKLLEAKRNRIEAEELKRKKEKENEVKKIQLVEEAENSKMRFFSYNSKDHKFSGALLIERLFTNKSSKQETSSYFYLVGELIEDQVQLSLYILNLTGNPFSKEDLRSKKMSDLLPKSVQKAASAVYIRTYSLADGSVLLDRCYIVPPAWYTPGQGIEERQITQKDFDGTPDYIENVFSSFSPLITNQIFESAVAGGQEYPEKMRVYQGEEIPVVEITHEGRYLYYSSDIPLAHLQSVLLENGEKLSVLKGSASLKHYLDSRKMTSEVSNNSVGDNDSNDNTESGDDDSVNEEVARDDESNANHNDGSNSDNSDNSDETAEDTSDTASEGDDDGSSDEDDSSGSDDLGDLGDWADLDF